MPNNNMSPTFKNQIEQAKSIANVHVAVAEFIDNSLDVNATKINLNTRIGDDGYDLYIVDNGTGMTFEKLNSSMILGSSSKTNTTGQLFGCKGVGMKLGSTHLANHSLEVFSKCKGDNLISYSKFHIKKMHDNPLGQDWGSLYFFKQLNNEDIQCPNVRIFMNDLESGTVIVLRGMDEDVCGNKKHFDKQILKSQKGIRRIYRHILTERGVEIIFNSSLITPSGPSFDFKPKYQDHVFQMTKSDKDGWISDKVYPWGSKSYDYRFRFVRVASKTNLGTSAQTGGLCVLRNKREVTSQLIAHIRPKNFAIGNLVIELDCPSEFIDKALTFNGDKQLRTLENATSAFDFKQWCKSLFKDYWEKIIEVNLFDGKAGSESESSAAWRHDEKTLVERFYNSQKENMSIMHTSEEINKLLIREYQLPGTGFKLDLVSKGIPFEFKTRSDDPTKIVGQVLSYLPYLIDNKEFSFVKDNTVNFKLALGQTPTESLKRHVKKINETFLIDGISVEIQILDMTEKCPQLLNFPMSRTEKNKLNSKVNLVA